MKILLGKRKQFSKTVGGINDATNPWCRQMGIKNVNKKYYAADKIIKKN